MPKPEIDLKHFKLLLVKLRDELMEAEKSEFDQIKTNSVQSQQSSINAQKRRKIQIRKIDAAWQRMENGEFGICLYCENKIEMERLKFDPTAVFCSECADDQQT